MSTPTLSSQKDAEVLLAELFATFDEPLAELPPLRLEVLEDKCFQDRWLDVGELYLRPELPSASGPEYEERGRFSAAVKYGFFDWQVPDQLRLRDRILDMLPKSNENEDSKKKKALEATKTIGHIAIRCGLAHPAFDAVTLSRMPFDRPVSITIDTNAVLQGGLDFVARHLTPQARIKVPAIVHMEILNISERYFTQRHKNKPSAQMLLDHLSSQGGQRVLLRLETNGGIEFDRPRLGADPLRGVVQPDSDAEDKSLGLQRIQRSFADRLILETVIQHRDRVGPDHRLMLLTADGGLARMAVAEGVEPVFFDSDAVSHLFGMRLSGTNFAPFSTDNNRLCSASLVGLLWEFATTFGAARLCIDRTDTAFEVLALGEDVGWQPYHSYEDLLWTRTNTVRRKNDVVKVEARGGGGREAVSVQKVPNSRGSGGRPLKGAYSFSLQSMLNLMVELDQRSSVTDEEAMAWVGVKSVSGYGEYYNFLLAGDFAKRTDGILTKGGKLSDLLVALRSAEFDRIAELLSSVTSFANFTSMLEVGNPMSEGATRLRNDAFRTYCRLAEIACKGMRIFEDGVYATPYNPTPTEFVDSAIQAYEAVRAGEAFALTGAWLEQLATRFGIHPVRARQRLAEASQSGYLRRFFEGSTPETRFENRNIHIVVPERGRPIVRTVNLYHGDFLIAGRASVSIKLVNGDDE